MAERIVAHFDAETLRMIEEEPGRLVEVPGLGPKRTSLITRVWEEQKAIKEVMVFLQGVGVSTSLAVRIYKTYRDSAIAIVQREPYRLAADVWGIGFKTADKIAQSLGIPHDSPERVKAGIQFTLSEASDEGHCYLPQPLLLAQAATILGVEEALAAYQRALAIDPSIAWAWNNKVATLRDLGRPEEALPARGRALELAPTDQLLKDNRTKVQHVLRRS
jgi:exodeoxyribonuclease V alpha subunit